MVASLNTGGTNESVDNDGAFDPVTDAFVYFQPPENIKLGYPCIIYSRDGGETEFADDRPYTHTTRYSVTVIDKNPDSELPGKVAMLPMCTHDRHYTKGNLNHDVFTLYY